MARGDKILFVSLAMALATIFAAACIQVTLDWTGEIAPLWAQAIGTVGAIVAAVLVPIRIEANKLRLEQRVAEVVVASALRSWLRVVAREVGDNQRFVGTGGHEGVEKFDIPSFLIEPGQVAKMRPAYARQVLSLMERRERHQGSIDADRYYGGDDDGLMEYYDLIGHLFWSARRIYQEIAVSRELDQNTSQTWEIETIRSAQRSADDYRASEKDADIPP